MDEETQPIRYKSDYFTIPGPDETELDGARHETAFEDAREVMNWHLGGGLWDEHVDANGDLVDPATGRPYDDGVYHERLEGFHEVVDFESEDPEQKLEHLDDMELARLLRTLGTLTDDLTTLDAWESIED